MTKQNLLFIINLKFIGKEENLYMALESFERETAIGFSDAVSYATITTFNRALMNKLDKLCNEHPQTYKILREIIIEDKVEGKEYTCPKKLISFRAPMKRKMTKEQRIAASERMKKMRKAKK